MLYLLHHVIPFSEIKDELTKFCYFLPHNQVNENKFPEMLKSLIYHIPKTYKININKQL